MLYRLFLLLCTAERIFFVFLCIIKPLQILIAQEKKNEEDKTILIC
jgi:hypothetical protein